MARAPSCCCSTASRRRGTRGGTRALGYDTAVVVGHDWGAPIAAATALLRPDIVRAVGLLGVPFAPRPPVRPTEAFGAAGGPDGEFYVSDFQRLGVEAEMESDPRSWLAGFLTALSGEVADGRVFAARPGGTIRERLPAGGARPPWLTERDLDREQGLQPRRGGADTAPVRQRRHPAG